MLLCAGAALLLGVHPETSWDARIDPACCPYPEHDPRDYNWPYSHLQYSEVIPHVMGSFVAMTSLNLTYEDADSSSVVVEYGKPIAPPKLAEAPRVAYELEPDRTSATLHTLMMVDPDDPFRDTPSGVGFQHLHWLVYDIPGNDTAKGKTLVEYAPPRPTPCPKADKLCLREHRVTFILWEQSHGPIQLHEEDVAIAATESAGRKRYKARDFAMRHRLGMQLAMNFFETWHHDGVGEFDERPWWHVRDDETLANVADVVPTVARGGGGAAAAATSTPAAAAAATPKGKKGKGKKKKDEL